jgi:predicted glycosyltransferase
MKVLMYCQHVLGIGHLVRSAEIARALSCHADVTFVSGGAAVDSFLFPKGVELVHLPAIQTDEDFGALESCETAHTLEELQDLRRYKLVGLLEALRPDALVIELFPFGRKRFAFELIPLLERTRNQSPRTLVACSLRDILVEKSDRAKHEARVCGIVNAYFDLIMVHGDPRFIRLEETFHSVEDLQCEVRYTGFVHQQEPGSATGVGPVCPTIVASIGSGRYRQGQFLLEALVRAAALLQGQIPHLFQIFAGPFIPEDVYAGLKRLKCELHNVEIEKYSPDFLGHLKRASLSISMGGYNTVMNLLATGVPSLVYPYTANDDQEQHIRARRLQSLGIVELLHPQVLSPDLLASKIVRMLEERPVRVAFDMGGAANSANILLSAVAAQMGRQWSAALSNRAAT